ncbi:MAG TPA: hypothetical protein LFW14_01090 [Rickettsia endosymbiont of Degeeriella rufa]|nr:hypothetical protein [Rickettsia endosymbiont of Degeeriella rufa]
MIAGSSKNTNIISIFYFFGCHGQATA